MFCVVYLDCGTPGTPKNSEVVIREGTLYGMVAVYTCKSGYTLSNADRARRTCESNGQWSGQAPTCKSDSKFMS